MDETLKNWYELDVGVDGALTLDVKDYCLSHPDTEGMTQIWIPGAAGVWLLDESDLFNPDWVRMVKDRLGLTVTDALVFFRTAGYQHPSAHIDIEPNDERDGPRLLPVSAGYNWVLEPTDAEMVWYEPWWDAEDYEQCLKAVQAGRSFDAVAIGDLAYNEIPVSRLKEAGRHRLSERCLTMVRTNLPHNVHMGSKDRWCVSARAFESTPGLWSLARDKMEAAILR